MVPLEFQHITNDIVAGEGFWHRRGYYRDVVVFEGDAIVGVAMEAKESENEYKIKILQNRKTNMLRL